MSFKEKAAMLEIDRRQRELGRDALKEHLARLGFSRLLIFRAFNAWEEAEKELKSMGEAQRSATLKANRKKYDDGGGEN